MSPNNSSNHLWDVVVVGAGNAALCAALAAAQNGAKVAVTEAASMSERGGNSYFTDGAMRFVHNGIDGIRQVVPSITDEQASNVVIAPYSVLDYKKDMQKINQNKSDEKLVKRLIESSWETLLWMSKSGIKFELIYDNQSFQKNNKHHFWGNLTIRTVGRGIGGVTQLFSSVEKLGVKIHYNTRIVKLDMSNGSKLQGVVTDQGETIRSKAVVLACGGFEANKEMRSKYMGENWDNAIVRGTAHNLGDGIKMALQVGAQKYGNWSKAHAVATDYGAPPTGDRTVSGDVFKKHSYPLGIMVNKFGKRFLDEGADLRNYTYAHYGTEVLNQPGNMAFQIFDSKTKKLLRTEYFEDRATSYTANSIPELAQKMGVDKKALEDTITAYNLAVNDKEFNPHIKDEKASNTDPPKSNWAQKIDAPPFLAFPVKCGITFTFGGLKADTKARVLDANDTPIPGLYVAGEMVGGLFYYGYPGGSGLTSGAVFGKIAGESAAKFL